jgi:FAD:protein FMN transferase
VKNRISLWCSIFLMTAALIGARCGAGETALSRYQYTQFHMGVGVRLAVDAPDEPAAARACEAAYRRFAKIEQAASDNRPSSELMRLCARAGGPPVPVSPELYVLLERAQDLSRLVD